MGVFGQEEMGFKLIKVKTSELLETIKINRDKHFDEYTLSIEGFMIISEKKIKDALKSIKKGNHPPYSITFEKPKNHTKDYDTIIAMLEMSVEKELEITYEQFLRYARDEWDWTDKFKSLSTIYNNG